MKITFSTSALQALLVFFVLAVSDFLEFMDDMKVA